MKVFLGGMVAVFLGIIGMFAFFGPFLHLLAGAIPLMLILGGAMAAYLGYDEVKDKLPFPKKKEEAAEPEASFKDEADKYKQEVERLKAELDKAKAGS
jgi:flagellar motor component MotA